jgi:hypothetical protein
MNQSLQYGTCRAVHRPAIMQGEGCGWTHWPAICPNVLCLVKLIYSVLLIYSVWYQTILSIFPCFILSRKKKCLGLFFSYAKNLGRVGRVSFFSCKFFIINVHAWELYSTSITVRQHRWPKHSLNITSILILKQTGYTFFVGFHGHKTYNTFVCGNTICIVTWCLIFTNKSIIYSS